MVNKKKWFLVRNYIASIISAIIAVFSLYQWWQNPNNQFAMTTGLIFSVAFIVTLVLNLKNKFSVSSNKGNVDEFPLLPGEEIIKEYNGVTVDGYAFLSYQKLFFKNVVLTNKRVALSSNYFGVESYKMPMSMFYKESDFEAANKLIRLQMKDVYKKNGYVYIKGTRKSALVPIKVTWKLKDADLIFDTATGHGVHSSLK